MRYFKAITRIVLVLSVLALVIVAMVKIPQRRCESIQVNAHTQNESVILAQKEVEQILTEKGIEIIGKRIKDVDLTEVTLLLEKNPYIKNINFIHFAGTRLLVDYDLRNIVMHVYDKAGGEYFVDSDGALVPFTSKMKDYLIIANGNIDQTYKAGATVSKDLQKALNVARKILADDFYSAQFRQIYLNETHQLELVASLGNQIILFGGDENTDEKLANLKVVYQEGLSRKGYDTYAMLDARYKNRIVAKRKQ